MIKAWACFRFHHSGRVHCRTSNVSSRRSVWHRQKRLTSSRGRSGNGRVLSMLSGTLLGERHFSQCFCCSVLCCALPGLISAGGRRLVRGCCTVSTETSPLRHIILPRYTYTRTTSALMTFVRTGFAGIGKDWRTLPS